MTNATDVTMEIEFKPMEESDAPIRFTVEFTDDCGAGLVRLADHPDCFALFQNVPGILDAIKAVCEAANITLHELC